MGKKRASEQIARELRRLIITGELGPGALVSEARLLEVLKCGRTPLREAVQELSHYYILVNPPRRGILIPQLTIDDFRQVHEAIGLMDAAWIELAAMRITDQQVRQLSDLVEEQEEVNGSRRFYELVDSDGRFHTLIVEATGNRYFADMRARLHGAVSRFVYRAYEAAGSAGLSVAEHREIVAALEKRDVDAARQTMRAHSSGSTDRILDTLLRGGQGGQM